MPPVPLHLTKVAFAIESLDHLAQRLRQRAADGSALTTRFLPKRAGEIEGGSLYWILRHQLVARSAILGFGEEGGRVAIRLAPELVLVEARHKRAHQGWRYLEAADAPPDLAAGSDTGALPPALMQELAALHLI